MFILNSYIHFKEKNKSNICRIILSHNIVYTLFLRCLLIALQHLLNLSIYFKCLHFLK